MINRSVIILALVLFLALAGLALAAQGKQDPSTSDGTHLDVEATRIAPTWGYRVINAYPHDTNAFTQGLVYVGGEFYEGTGLNGQSTLRRVEVETGQVQQIIALDEEYFGEGVAIIDDQIYQITYRSEVAFLYDRKSFELLDTFTYYGEGWGLTNDESHLIMSNGSSRIVFRDPDTFWAVRQVEVRDGDLPISLLNELEWIDGEIWANVYYTDWIVRIDPETGTVVGWIDLTGLLPDDVPEEEVGPLNGIAYDAETGRIFVTGKLWPLLFEIELIQPR